MGLINRLRAAFSNKPKSYLLDNKFEVVEAFIWKGESYFMMKNPLDTLAGRGLTALVFMEELLTRCDREYLTMFCQAKDALYSDPKKINLSEIMRLDNHLKERLRFQVAIPDHVYKLASVTFWTKDESPFKYDMEKGAEKIKAWKEAPDMYSFFLLGPLSDLVPSLKLPEQNSKQYLEVVEKISRHHFQTLQDILSSKT
jgi:hypothetical protein